jgi:hypothetical protein
MRGEKEKKSSFLLTETYIFAIQLTFTIKHDAKVVSIYKLSCNLVENGRKKGMLFILKKKLEASSSHTFYFCVNIVMFDIFRENM